MDAVLLTAITSVLLVIAGFAQITIMRSQRCQESLQLIEAYRQRWQNAKDDFGAILYFGGDFYDYYQIVDHEGIARLNKKATEDNFEKQTVWAHDSLKVVSGILSDICAKVLQGQIDIQDAYPALGTDLLRYSRRFRTILDAPCTETGRTFEKTSTHLQIRDQLQDWLIYHDGRRRRCLILIDLLWAEAARLEDLPPSDLLSAAESKLLSGQLNRYRLFSECMRLNGLFGIALSWKLSQFLRHAEFRGRFAVKGISKKRLNALDVAWTARLLRQNEAQQDAAATP